MTAQRHPMREPESVADVTVVMPAMNRATLIGRALDSVSEQTIAPREVLVIDDASTDDTVDVARAHGATVLELAVNAGSGPARNAGIDAARTEWVAFLDSDDTWHPEHLATTLERAGDHVLVCAPGRATGGRILGNASGQEVELSSLTALTPGDLICTSGTLVRRQVLLDAGLFRPLRRAQDLDMWIRVLEHGSGLALAQPTFTYTLHDQQAIADSELMRQCYGQIIESSLRRPWFSPRDADRAWTRWHWDDLRLAQRERRAAQAWTETAWFARHPHVWGTLLTLLRQRRDSRAH